ncbi:MAG TPA: hypothetical protein VMH83_02670, partial [Candidatus Acidoferrum sp.]|nr:hypothetical protein [Candidatus Acidoferrum sp.]
HPQFRPEGFDSLKAWKSARRARLKDPVNINISLRDFQLVDLTEDTAVVRFWLDYSRPGYTDHTHKELGLRLEGQIWMIEREHNLEVTKVVKK